MALRRDMRFWLAAGLLLLILAVGIGWWWMQPRFDEEEIRTIVVSTIQREAPQSFYVTGRLDLTATVSASNARYVLPDLPFVPDALRFNLGTSEARVRAPGRVSYGFDVRQIRAQDIRVSEEGIVDVTLPDLSIYSVEPRLDRMEIETSKGWARFDATDNLERAALDVVGKTMREQAESHLAVSTQPRVNTARALEVLLSPALQAAGIPDPRFRFRIGPRIVMEPEG